jgi:TldD protein
MDVVIQIGWGGVLVHEAVGHPLEADNIAKQSGNFVGKLARKWRQIFLPWLMMAVWAVSAEQLILMDEGTQMKRNVLIERGVVVKFMTDILSARQLKMERDR